MILCDGGGKEMKCFWFWFRNCLSFIGLIAKIGKVFQMRQKVMQTTLDEDRDITEYLKIKIAKQISGQRFVPIQKCFR